MIHWHGEEDENGFPDLRKCLNMRSVSSHSLNTATLVSLLNACGSTLEQLSVTIKPVGDSVDVMEAIRHQCKNLSVLKVVNLKDVIDIVGQKSYVSLICSYGSKLKDTTTDGLCHERLVEVVNACTNLEVTFFWMSKQSADWRQVHALGSRVATLVFRAKLLHGKVYPGAIRQCSNVRKLHLSGHLDIGRGGVTDEMIMNVFSASRFLKLEDLIVTSFRANERNMALIASCTANLKSASFDPFQSDSEVSVFQVIADSNKDLKNISIYIDDFSGSPRSPQSLLESLGELVKMFRKCRKLKFGAPCTYEGEIEKEDLMRTCRFLPCRDVEVNLVIGDICFQYPN